MYQMFVLNVIFRKTESTKGIQKGQFACKILLLCQIALFWTLHVLYSELSPVQ